MDFFNQVDFRPKATEIDILQDWIVPKDDMTWNIIKKQWEEYHSKKWFDKLENKRVVIQAGGSIGLYPRLLSDIFEVVYTFEPSDLSFYCLSHNCQKKNIFKFEAALGIEPAFVCLESIVGNIGMNKTRHGGMIPQMTIDQFNFPIVDLIALDVEGSEYEVLLGALKTIERCHPRIILENGQSDAIKKLLDDNSYVIIDESCQDTIWNV